jgi:antitoxin MazE
MEPDSSKEKTMLARVQKWGNSLALRLPKALAEEAEIHLDSPVEITIRDHMIVIEPMRKKRRYELDELLSGVRPENLHGETDFGGPVGTEVW